MGQEERQRNERGGERRTTESPTQRSSAILLPSDDNCWFSALSELDEPPFAVIITVRYNCSFTAITAVID